MFVGEYRIGLKFNDQHVPDSPFKVYISPAVGDAHLLEVIQFPEGHIQADKPSQFLVRRNGAKGDLDAKVSFNYVVLNKLMERRGFHGLRESAVAKRILNSSIRANPFIVD